MACGSWLTGRLLQCGAGGGLPREKALAETTGRHEGPWLDKRQDGKGYAALCPQRASTFLLGPSPLCIH